MKGLEEAELCYERFGREMISSQFPEYESRIAVGLAGHGSECFGFDDGLSRDHDFLPGFCLWLTDEDDAAIGVALSRAYNSLPFPNHGQSVRSALAESSRGVRRISDYYRRYTGSPGAPGEWRQWMALPSCALAEAVNGKVFRDDLGIFSREREIIASGMPEDVRLKKIAAKAVAMAQSGQYNFMRCIKHGEPGAAQLAADEFVRSACEMIFLLNRAHAPYYKWIFRAMRNLSQLSSLADALEFILSAEADAELKFSVIEDTCAVIIRFLHSEGLSCSSSDYLEQHAFEIAGRIQNSEIRAMHIMEG